MTLLHTCILILVAVATLVVGFAFGLCITAKRADEAFSRAMGKYDEDHNDPNNSGTFDPK